MQGARIAPRSCQIGKGKSRWFSDTRKSNVTNAISSNSINVTSEKKLIRESVENYIFTKYATGDCNIFMPHSSMLHPMAFKNNFFGAFFMTFTLMGR